jgi:hypothetical protein
MATKRKPTINKKGRIIKPKTLTQKTKAAATRKHNKISGKTK